MASLDIILIFDICNIEEGNVFLNGFIQNMLDALIFNECLGFAEKQLFRLVKPNSIKSEEFLVCSSRLQFLSWDLFTLGKVPVQNGRSVLDQKSALNLDIGFWIIREHFNAFSSLTKVENYAVSDDQFEVRFCESENY